MIGGVYVPTMVPLRARTVAAFAAADPWHGGRGAQWSLEVFRMVSEDMERASAERSATLSQLAPAQEPDPEPPGGFSPAEKGRLRRGEVLGLLNREEGRPRLLPIVLTQMWQEGAVPTAALPRLMAAMEPRTLTSDFFSSTARAIRWMAAGFAMAALLFLAVAAAAWAFSGRSPREVAVADWLSYPVAREQQVSGDGLLRLDGHVAAGTVHQPNGMHSDGGDFPMDGGGPNDYVLGWYKAAEGERLLLLTPFAAQGIARGADQVRLEGAVVRTADLQLAPAVLQVAAARAPGPPGGYVLCDGWRWDDWNLVGDPAPVLFGAGLFLLFAAYFYMRHRLRLRRLAWLRREFAKLA